jgi:acetoin utilization deacetylase AcuC-like enzyme
LLEELPTGGKRENPQLAATSKITLRNSRSRLQVRSYEKCAKVSTTEILIVLLTLYYTDEFVLPLPPAHTFPMAKYRLLRERVQASRTLPAHQLCIPPQATWEQLARVHDEEYLHAMTSGTISPDSMKRIGFPWSAALVTRSRYSSGATLAASYDALQVGVGINLAGGTHHAFRDHGEGYCLFNDTVIAARELQATGRVQRVLAVDLDVHQGNGTAALTRGDASIYTLSVHGAKNYPTRKERSDLDVELPDGTADQAYLDALEPALRQAFEDSRAEFVFYLAGADPFEGDRLGRLKLTKAGLAERDRLVLDSVRWAGVPVVVSMAGGYAKDVTDTVDIQWATVERFMRGE